MTIVTSVKVRDGLILGTDSMSQVQISDPQGQPQFIKAYENARKLFQVGDLPIGVMSYGLGNIGQRSIESLMFEFGRSLWGQVAVKSIATELLKFVKEKYETQFAGIPELERPVLGFYLAGYSRGQVFPEEHEFLLPHVTSPIASRPKEEFGVSWRGIERPFTRLCMGYDARIVERLLAKGMSNADVEAIVQDLQMPVVYDGMPIQDAVNYGVYVLNTTIGYSAFEIGNPPCGGPLQVATILPDKGFTWVLQPTVKVL